MTSDNCPCGSGRPYAVCCAPLHRGEATAATAPALMRSRYCAYVLGDAGYLSRTWHPDTRPAALDLDGQPDWTDLEILDTEAGSETDDRGTVEFIARYRAAGGADRLHERSRFVREDGRWLYVDGSEPPARAGARVGRNAPCPCGSGRKYKRCCGR